MPGQSSTSSTSSGHSAKGQSSLKLSKSTYQLFRGNLIPAIKAHPNGRKILRMINKPMVLETRFHQMSLKDQDAHFAAQAALLIIIKLSFSLEQHSEILAFSLLETENPPLEEDDDGNVVYPEDYDKNLPPHWPSAGQAALNFVGYTYGTVDEEGKSDISTVKDALESYTLADTRGDLHEFRSKYLELRQAYMNACVQAGREVNNVDMDCAADLIKMFQAFDPQVYGMACTLERQSSTKTCGSVLKAMMKEFVAKRAQALATGAAHGAAPTALVSAAPPKASGKNDREIIALLQRLEKTVDTRSDKGKKPKGPRFERKPFVDPAKEALWQYCYKNGVCFKNTQSKCPWGEKDCKFEHKAAPPPHHLANISVFKPDESDVILLVSGRVHEKKEELSASEDEAHDEMEYHFPRGSASRRVRVSASSSRPTVRRSRSASPVTGGWTIVHHSRSHERKEEPEDDAMWLCDICYDENEPAATKCSSCIQPRFAVTPDQPSLPSAFPRGGEPQQGADSGWPCPRCTFANHADIQSCEMCDATRISSPIALVTNRTSSTPAADHASVGDTAVSASATLTRSASKRQRRRAALARRKARKEERRRADLAAAHLAVARLGLVVAAEDSDTDDIDKATSCDGSTASDTAQPATTTQQDPPPLTMSKKMRKSVAIKRYIAMSQGLATYERVYFGIHVASTYDAMAAIASGSWSPLVTDVPSPLDSDCEDSDLWYKDPSEALCDHLQLQASRATADLPDEETDVNSKEEEAKDVDVSEPDEYPTQYITADYDCGPDAEWTQATYDDDGRMRTWSSRSDALSKLAIAQEMTRRLGIARRFVDTPVSDIFLDLATRVWHRDQLARLEKRAAKVAAQLVIARNYRGSHANPCFSPIALASAAASPVFDPSTILVVDTGANHTVFGSTGIFSCLTAFKPCAAGRTLQSNGHADRIIGNATFSFCLQADAGGYTPALSIDGIVSPDSAWNLIPPQALPGFASATIAKSGAITISFGDGTAVTTVPHRGLQVLKVRPVGASVACVSSGDATPAAAMSALNISPPPSPLLTRLHNTLGHAGVSTIHRLVRSGSIHIADPASRTALLACKRLECRHCALASAPSAPITPTGQGHLPSLATNGLWSMDFFGPFEQSAGLKKWPSMWVSHATHKIHVGYHKSKGDAPEWFSSNYPRLESEDGGRRITALLADNGETRSVRFDAICHSLGITRHFTSPGSSFQNGRAERAIRTIRAMAGASLSRSGLPATFWAEAMAHSVYVHNRLPKADGLSPNEHAFGSGQSTTMRHIHPFGALVLSRAVQPKKSRLHNKARAAVMLSPATSTKDGFKIMHLDTKSIAVSRNLAFFDMEFPFNATSAASSPLGHLLPSVDGPQETRLSARAAPKAPSYNPFGVLEEPDAPLEQRRSTRVTAKPAELYSPDAHAAQHAFDSARSQASQPLANVVLPQEEQPAFVALDDEPRFLADALLRDNRDEWLAAVSRELASHFKNGTWEAVSEMPHGRAAIPSKWVFKTKLLADGTVDKLKARLVAKGFRQRRNIDYHESFAPTLRPTSFRLICALAVHHSFALHQMDVSTAFLIPTLEEEIYMRLPEQGLVSLHLPSFASKTPIVRLRKTLYGLVQSSAKFFKHFSNILKKMSFVQSKHDPCLWIKIEDGTIKAFIGIWVDDCAIAAPPEDIGAIKGHLKTFFDMTDGGPISWFLSIKIKNDMQRGTVTLDQQPTIIRLLQSFDMNNCKAVCTPIEARLVKPTNEPSADDLAFMKGKNYRSLVGSLMYLLFTRPDISFAVNQLTRHLNDPRPDHWRAAIRLLRYLKGTQTLALTYRRPDKDKGQSAVITGFSDADWGGDTETRRSTSGIIFIVCGAAFSWRTKLQTSTALSTCEAELNALTEAAKEAIWVRYLVAEMQATTNDDPVQIFEDNQAAILITENHRFSEKTKHVAIKYFFVREQVANGAIKVTYCPTNEMIADIFTKPLTRIAFETLRLLLGLEEISEHK
jgi:hypothetical protein